MTSVTEYGVTTLIKSTTDHPCVQVLDFDEKPNNRVTCTLWDGKDEVSAIFSKANCPQFAEGKLETMGLIRINQHTVISHGGKNIINVLGMDVLEASMKEKVLSHATGATGASPITPGQTMAASKPSSGGAKPSPGSRRVCPISAINPYQGNWTIKARITNLGQLRTFNSKAGNSGKVMNIDLMDESGTEIRATMWHEMAEEWHAKLQQGKVYYISRGTLKMAQKQYRQLANDYEMTLNKSSEIEEAEDDMAPLAVTYDFTTFENLGQHIGNKVPFDVLGVVKAMGELGTVKRKNDGSELVRRDVTLLDSSSKTVTLTLWNQLAEDSQFDKIKDNSTHVLAAKYVRASDYNGVSLSTISKTILTMDPEIPEALKLKQWYEDSGRTAPTTSAGEGLASAKSPGQGRSNAVVSLKEVQPEDLAPTSAPPEFHNVRVTVARASTKNNMWYNSCPEEGCNKKVIEENGGWYCESHQQSFPECKRRYIAQFQVMDSEGSAWVSTFNEQAQTLLGRSADEMADIRSSSEQGFAREIKKSDWKPYMMTVRSKTDEYNGDARRRITVQSVRPMTWAAECQRLVQEIQALS